MKKVILIGGCPFSGKTTLARELAAKDKYSCISTDDLGAAVKAAVPDEDFHPMSGVPYPEYYVKYSINELIEHAATLHRRMVPSIKAVINAHANQSSPAVIEGWALYPDWISTLPYSNTDSLWLIASQEVLLNRIRADKQFYEKCSNPELMVRQYLARCVWQNNKFMTTAVSLGMKIINVDTAADINEPVKTAYDLLNRDS